MKSNQVTIPYREIGREEFSDDLLLLEQHAVEAAQKAYAPYSHFYVGAAVRLSSGTIVTGSNQENAAYPSGLCAERTALFSAGALYPNDPVEALLIVAFSQDERVETITPCGACRQVLMEVSGRFNRPFQVIMVGEKRAIVLDDNKGLLPFAFDGSDLPKE